MSDILETLKWKLNHQQEAKRKGLLVGSQEIGFHPEAISRTVERIEADKERITKLTRKYNDAVIKHTKLVGKVLEQDNRIADLEEITTAAKTGQHCQSKDCRGDICLAGAIDGVTCPEYSCDIDDGLRMGALKAQPPEAQGQLQGRE